MKFIRSALVALLALVPAVAGAQSVGQLGAGLVWGNSTAARAPAAPSTITALIDRAISGTQGALLTRNGSAWIGLAPGTAGLPLLSGGAAANLAYGIPALAAGGTGANLTASNGGIFYSNATTAAVLSATATARQMVQSGASAAPAWSTTTWPATTSAGRILVSATANTITDTSTPTLGDSGTLGSVSFGNATSGLVTVQPVAGALGTVTQSLPAASGTFAVSASLPIVLGATSGALTCPTCVTSSGGGAITGTAPITVSAAGAVSLDAAGVTYAKIQNLGALAVMGRSANTSGVGADIQATAASDSVLRESGSTIGFGTIATNGIANNAVTLAKLATQATNTVLGNATAGSAVPTALSVASCSTASSAMNWTTNTGFGCNTSITAAIAPAGTLTGSTLAAGVTASSLTSVGTLTTLTVSGAITGGTNGGTGGSVVLNGSTSGSGTIKVAAAAGTGTIFQIPATNGTSTQVLQTNGSGITSWVDAAGGGTVTSVTCNGGTTVITASGTCASREVLSTTRNYYVRTDGSDSNTGLVNDAAGAFLTIQKCVNVAAALDMSIYGTNCNVADGAYNATVSLKSYVGNGPLSIVGNTGTPANVTITVASNFPFLGQSVIGNYQISGMTLSASTGGYDCILVTGGTNLSLSTVNFGACGQAAMHVTYGAQVLVNSNYTISGGGAIHWYTDTGGIITAAGRTITLSGSPVFSTAFAFAGNASLQVVNGNTFSGAAGATTPRYNVSNNAVISTGTAGTSYLPGTSAGTGTNPGTTPFGLYN